MNTNSLRRTATFFATLILAATAVPSARAQQAPADYPNRPIRWVVPYTPGGATDTVTRVVAQKIQEAWGQPVIVENKPGAASNIGTEIVAKAPADGYTLLLAVPTLATNGELFKGKLGFDPERSFTAVSQMLGLPNAVVVPANSPFRTIQDLIAAARAKPGSLTYGSAGTGSLTHLGFEYFKGVVGVDVAHVPYKGSTPVIQDLAVGVLPLASDNVPTHVPQIRAGKERALVVLGSRRLAALPDVPTMAEAGYPNFEAGGWAGVVVPAGTPSAIVDKLSREVQRILKLPDVRKRFEEPGYVVVGSTPAEFDALIRADRAKWSKLIRDLDIRAD